MNNFEIGAEVMVKSEGGCYTSYDTFFEENNLNEFKDNFTCGNLVNANEVYAILGKGVNDISGVEIFVLGDSIGKVYLMSNQYEEIYLYERE